MGREVIRVPADWEHPKKPDGSYHPMHMDRPYDEEAAEWKEEAALWERGEHPNQKDGAAAKYDCDSFEDWHGEAPDPDYYRHRKWTAEEATHWQMYETTSEGTPISPVMDSPESLARWLADNNASTFADMTATYDQWLTMITGTGWAPSAIMSVPGGLESGVVGVAAMGKKPA